MSKLYPQGQPGQPGPGQGQGQPGTEDIPKHDEL